MPRFAGHAGERPPARRSRCLLPEIGRCIPAARQQDRGGLNGAATRRAEASGQYTCTSGAGPALRTGSAVHPPSGSGRFCYRRRRPGRHAPRALYTHLPGRARFATDVAGPGGTHRERCTPTFRVGHVLLQTSQSPGWMAREACSLPTCAPGGRVPAGLGRLTSNSLGSSRAGRAPLRPPPGFGSPGPVAGTARRLPRPEPAQRTASAARDADSHPIGTRGSSPCARSARTSPSRGPNLKPCPEVPAPMTMRPTRSTTKFSSGLLS